MIEIKNLQFQPLTFQLGGEGSLHLGPRQKKNITRNHLSPEIQTAAKRGLVRITELNKGAAQTKNEPAGPKEAASKEGRSGKTKERK